MTKKSLWKVYEKFLKFVIHNKEFKLGDSMEKWTLEFQINLTFIYLHVHTLCPSTIIFNKTLVYQQIDKPNWCISLQ